MTSELQIEDSIYWIKQYRICTNICELAHRGQFRRDKITPYHIHPKRIAVFFLKENNYFFASIALLHDVLEDTDYTLKDLEIARVDFRICEIVDQLTRKKEENYFSYIERICMYRKFPIVELKIADIVDNLTDNPTEIQKEKYTKALMNMVKKLHDTK